MDERFWCPFCESIQPADGFHDCGNLESENALGVDTYETIGYFPIVDSGREYVGSLKSLVSSTGRRCPQHSGQHGARDFKKPTSPTPRGTTSDNGMPHKRGECPLCCITGSIPCGSGKHLDKNSQNPYNFSSLSAPAGHAGRQGLSPAYFLPVILLVPYCLLSFNLFKAVICG